MSSMHILPMPIWSLLHIQPSSNLWHWFTFWQYKIALSDPQPYPADVAQISPKAPVYNLYNPILLFRRHLVIRGKTQPSTENIGSNVHSWPLYVRICTASAVPFRRHKRVHPIHRLHMHGLWGMVNQITTTCCIRNVIIQLYIVFSCIFSCSSQYLQSGTPNLARQFDGSDFYSEWQEFSCF